MTTIEEATRQWIQGFREIPLSIIEQLFLEDPDAWEELTINDSKDDEMEKQYGIVELPMWGTMWQFEEFSDDWLWLHYGNGIQMLSQCGFRVYRHRTYGYFFGIDGAGYDFYKEHWIPLYKARGVQWHDISSEQEIAVRNGVQ